MSNRLKTNENTSAVIIIIYGYKVQLSDLKIKINGG